MSARFLPIMAAIAIAGMAAGNRMVIEAQPMPEYGPVFNRLGEDSFPSRKRSRKHRGKFIPSKRRR